MAASTPKQVPISLVAGEKNANSQSIQEKITRRQSQELVIALSGPAGSGVRTTVKHFQELLKTVGYNAVVIKLSSHIKEKFKSAKVTKESSIPPKLKDVDVDNLGAFDRYEKLQDIGNYLREAYEPNILAQVAISEILLHRAQIAKADYERLKKEQKIPEGMDEAKFTVEMFVPPKTAYLIDQLKNPAEVELLRDVYGDLFYLIGNLCGEEERKQNLITEGLKEKDAASVMIRDKRENEEHGQQLERTLQLSDYFISNVHGNHKELDHQIQRLIDIVHRTHVFTPTKDEHGMYVAHSAALRSACLSRQVGASIADQNGQVIATGCNDVPKYDGGLYTVEDNSKEDLRCYNKGGKCYNDDYKKRLIRDKLSEILERHHVQQAKELAEEMFRSTRLKHLIEFSRSIHAEMDALISIARKGGVSTKGCTLYTTTYPCHSCAGHIVAAGIHRVVYIEPYEKSLAIELHGEAISTEKPSAKAVLFTHFVGVSPRRYQDFFLANEERKDKSGAVIVRNGYTLKPKIHQFLDSYRSMETKVLEHLKDTGLATAEGK